MNKTQFKNWKILRRHSLKEYSELAEKTKEEGEKILNRFSKKKVGEQ